MSDTTPVAETVVETPVEESKPRINRKMIAGAAVALTAAAATALFVRRFALTRTETSTPELETEPTSDVTPDAS